jgi:hypothetical protein
VTNDPTPPSASPARRARLTLLVLLASAVVLFLAIILGVVLYVVLGEYRSYRRASTWPKDSPQAIMRWVDHFDGETIAQVQEELGHPTERGKWEELKVAGGEKLTYRLDGRSKLILFCNGDSVSAVLLTVGSE